MQKVGDLEKVKKYLSEGVNIDTLDSDGCTPLYCASKYGHVSVVEYLLQQGADTEVRMKEGERAVMVAARKGHSEIVRLLLEHGAEVDAQDNGGWTALHFGVLYNQLDCTRVLLKHQANPDIGDYDNQYTPLHHAAGDVNGRDLVTLLIQHKATVDKKSNIECTPLMVAVGYGKKETVRELLRYKASVNLCDEVGCSPLHLAAETNHSDVVKLLCEAGANVNATDKLGDTALHVAAKKNGTEAVKTLLRYSPTLSKNEKGKTALDIAKENSCANMVNLLEECTEPKQSEPNVEASPRKRERPQSGIKHYTRTLQGELNEMKNLLTQQQGVGQSYVKRFQCIEEQLQEILGQIEKLELKQNAPVEETATADTKAELWREVSKISEEMGKLPAPKETAKDLGNQHLYYFAKKVGSKWKHLGACLGIDFHAIEQIEADHPHDSVYQTWAMLVHWRDRQTKTANEQKAILRQAVKGIERMDLLSHI